MLPRDKFKNLSEEDWKVANEITSATRWQEVLAHTQDRVLTPEEVKELTHEDYDHMYKKAVAHVNQVLMAHYADRADEPRLDVFLKTSEYAEAVVVDLVTELKLVGWDVGLGSRRRDDDEWLACIHFRIPREQRNLTEDQERRLDMKEAEEANKWRSIREAARSFADLIDQDSKQTKEVNKDEE
jgi:hypothetical protein